MLILLTRHGESHYNIENRLGGDSSLSENGKQYARKLSHFQKNHTWFPKECIISTKKRTLETVVDLSYNMDFIIQKSELDEINAGIAENMTYEQFNSVFPEESKLRAANKLSYRYPEGESYEDLISRVKPIVDQILKRQKDVLIVCHRAIIRVLLYYFTDIDKKNIPHIEVPLHQLIVIKNNNMTYIEVI